MMQLTSRGGGCVGPFDHIRQLCPMMPLKEAFADLIGKELFGLMSSSVFCGLLVRTNIFLYVCSSLYFLVSELSFYFCSFINRICYC